MRYFYLTVLILCLSAVQESSFSGVKSTGHPKHGNKYKERDHGTGKPENTMRHLQHEKERQHDVKGEKLQEGRHVRDHKSKEVRHVKRDSSNDVKHVRHDHSKDVKHVNSKEVKHVNSKDVKHVNSKEVKYVRHDKSIEMKHVKHESSKGVKHVKHVGLKEVKHIKHDGSKEVNRVELAGSKERKRVRHDGSKESKHLKHDSSKIKHVKNDKLKEHVNKDKSKEETRIKYDESKVSTSQNTTRKHPKDIKHIQKDKKENVKHEKLKILTSQEQKSTKTFENVTTRMQRLKIGRGTLVTKFPDKILHHKRKGRVSGKHSHGNHTSHNRKHKKSSRHQLKHDKSKPAFRASSFSSDDSISNTEEAWPEEWDDYWMKKKQEALNSTQIRGDVMNMAVARPWAFPCGDPAQHDSPWGTCMAAPECESEFRIFRGDSFCGRTSLVCCALQMSTYDFYQGLDISFGGTSFSTDSKEEKATIIGSKEIKRRLEKRLLLKRQQERVKRKKRMIKSIKLIVQEIKSILNKAYKNGTLERQRKANRIREYINNMKKQYRQDRKNLIRLHHDEMIMSDDKLQAKLNQVRGVNEAFMSNNTFRDIIINGTINKERLMVMFREHPQMTQYFKNRRSGGGEPYAGSAQEEMESEVVDANSNAKEYDVEYGILYY